MPQFEEQGDELLEEERWKKFKGTVRVALEVLNFERDQAKDLDVKQVIYLKECFKDDACRRLELQNHIPALIDHHLFATVAAASGISAEDLLDKKPPEYPELVFPHGFKLKCLRGRHRIQAGREFLAPGDRWWTVDLYLSGKFCFLGEVCIS